MKYFTNVFHIHYRAAFFSGISLEIRCVVKKIIFLFMIILIYSGSAYAGQWHYVGRNKYNNDASLVSIKATKSVWECRVYVINNSWGRSEEVKWVKIVFNMSKIKLDHRSELATLAAQNIFVLAEARNAVAEANIEDNDEVNYLKDGNYCYLVKYYK